VAGSSVSLSNDMVRMCTLAGSIGTDPLWPQMHEVRVSNWEIIREEAYQLWCAHPWWYGCRLSFSSL